MLNEATSCSWTRRVQVSNLCIDLGLRECNWLLKLPCKQHQKTTMSTTWRKIQVRFEGPWVLTHLADPSGNRQKWEIPNKTCPNIHGNALIPRGFWDMLSHCHPSHPRFPCFSRGRSWRKMHLSLPFAIWFTQMSYQISIVVLVASPFWLMYSYNIV